MYFIIFKQFFFISSEEKGKKGHHDKEDHEVKYQTYRYYGDGERNEIKNQISI